jgi:hypothetical protein
VHNTNALLGHDGFVGIKTGSDDAAGGCFAFRAIRWIDGMRTTITGVVLGQPGHDRIAAGLAAAAAMVDASPVIHRKDGMFRIYGKELWYQEPSASRPTSRAGHRRLRADPRRGWARR